MTYILIFTLGIIVGGILVNKIKAPKEEGEELTGLIEQQVKRKEQNLQRVLELFEGQERVTNNDVESLLNVSDATSTNYLEELEQKGKIKQVGKTGRHVYYKFSNG